MIDANAAVTLLDLTLLDYLFISGHSKYCNPKFAAELNLDFHCTWLPK